MNEWELDFNGWKKITKIRWKNFLLKFSFHFVSGLTLRIRSWVFYHLWTATIIFWIPSVQQKFSKWYFRGGKMKNEKCGKINNKWYENRADVKWKLLRACKQFCNVKFKKFISSNIFAIFNLIYILHLLRPCLHKRRMKISPSTGKRKTRKQRLNEKSFIF